MDNFEILSEICHSALISKGLSEYKERLNQELKEIKIQKESSYFLDLYDRKVRYKENENNLLVAYLLGLTPSVEMGREADHTIPEWP